MGASDFIMNISASVFNTNLSAYFMKVLDVAAIKSDTPLAPPFNDSIRLARGNVRSPPGPIRFVAASLATKSLIA
jgi:hypothetical protein